MVVIMTKLTIFLLCLPLLIGLSLLIGFCVLIIYRKKRVAKMLGHYVHSLPELPIIGNFITIIKLGNTTGFWNFVTEHTSKHREGVLFSVFHLNWVFIQEVDVVETVLLGQDNCDKAYIYSLFATITKGTFACNGLLWHKLRKKLNLTFSPKQIDLHWDDVNEQTTICIESLNKNLNKYINIRSFLASYFIDIIFRTHYGAKTKEQITKKHQITEHAAKLFETIMQNRFFNVFLHPKIIYRWTQLSEFTKYYREEPLAYIRKLISQRIKMVESAKEKGEELDEKDKLCFVDLVREILPEVNIKPTLHSIESHISDIAVAGSDTTSINVSTLIYYLAIYPEIQEKIYQEVAPIFGEHRTKYLDREDLSKMNYLEMAIKETLRLTAPPGIVREISKDTDVGKYILPKGINTFIALKAIHENPAYWEKPTQFYPEHFLPEKVSARPKHAFIPFSAGPRNCPGMAFAYIIMKMVTSTIVRNYKLETDIPLEKITFKMVIMQENEDGFRIKLTPRPQ